MTEIPLDIDTLSVEEIPIPPVSETPIVPDYKKSRIRKTREPRTSDESTVRIPRRKGQFVQPLSQLYTGLAITLMPVDMQCATAIIKSADNCAKALDELAYQNESVRKVLWNLTQVSALGTVLIAHLPIMFTVLSHHVPAFKDTPMGALASMFVESEETVESNVEE